MNILVTGCAGFIGSWLCEKLVLNHDNAVFGVDNFYENYNKSIKIDNMANFYNRKNFSFYNIDIRDFKRLNHIFKKHSINKVVHLAGLGGVHLSMYYPQRYIENNIEGTVNVLECIRENHASQIVFASSSAVYGKRGLHFKKFSEDNPCCPLSFYAQTKKTCEEIICNYSHLYGMNAVCLRFFTVFGPRQRPDMSIFKFAKAIYFNNMVELYGYGQVMRDYTYIDDIIAAIISAMKYDESPFEIINIGSSKPVCLENVIKLIEKLLNKRVDITYYPLQQGDLKYTYANIKKAKKLLKYRPRVSFEEGLRRFIKYPRAPWKQKY